MTDNKKKYYFKITSQKLWGTRVRDFFQNLAPKAEFCSEIDQHLPIATWGWSMYGKRSEHILNNKFYEYMKFDALSNRSKLFNLILIS